MLKKLKLWWSKSKKKAEVKSPVESPIILLAGDYDQACWFAWERGLSLSDWKYINTPWGLKGLDRSNILVACGTFYDRDDIEEFLAEIWVGRLRLYNAPD